VSIAAVITACTSFRPQVTAFATDYNRAIADSRNQMVLLNIVRSSFGEPTHYSTLSQVEATLGYKANIGGGVGGLNSGTDPAYGTLAVETSSAPTMTVIPLNTEEFAAGVLRPIDASALRLLVPQGWDSRMLSALLISKIECEAIAPGENHRRYVSNAVPADPGPVFTSPFADVGINLISPEDDFPDEGHESFDMTLDGGKLADLLSSGFDERFRIRQLGGENRYRVTRRPDEINFSIPQGLIDCPQAPATNSGGPGIYAGGQKVHARAYLRSIEGVIRFLGDVVASNTALAYVDGSGPQGDKHILFAVDRSATAPASIRVTYRGQSFAIAAQPPRSHDQSARVISLINQLLALQTSSDVLKRAPSTVRVR
jgi:hypothetical protein